MDEAATRQTLLRSLPAVHRLLEHPAGADLVARYGRELAAQALAQAQDEVRGRIRAATAEEMAGIDVSPEALCARAASWLEALLRPHLRPVINATGVVVHTNLGRSRLPRAARDAVLAVAERYSTLEYDLDRGSRGSRHAHLERLLPRLTGAEAAIAVNNNAAAVLLVLSALAAGREVIVSRGELVEIGGSFRIPEVMAQSGARLVEVGTTNKTRLDDYRRAIGPDTAALLKVHTSNYRIIGFTEAPGLAELAALAAEHDLPLLYDLGSGVLLDLAARGIPGEPTVQEAIAAGAALVTFSGDKLLGGPQAGIIAGRRDLVERCARHPLARAVRIDKMTAAALEATLTLYLDPERAVREVPTLRMLLTPPEELEERAAALAQRLGVALRGLAEVAVARVRSAPGGGSLPGVELPSAAVALRAAAASAAALERALRAGDPPVIARIEEGRLLLDLRTVDPAEEDELLRVVVDAVRSLAPAR